MYRGICTKHKVANKFESLPCKGKHWANPAECEDIGEMLDNGNFIEINDIQCILPKLSYQLNETSILKFDSNISNLKNVSRKKSALRNGIIEMSQALYEALNNMKWINE